MQRRFLLISGRVQGVGFRPFIYTLAHGLGLSGFVRNVAGAVQVEVEGPTAAVDRFLKAMVREAPVLARVQSVEQRTIAARGQPGFEIWPSDFATGGTIESAPDIATCNDCLREIFDPHDRRYGYPFSNCTHCGPRLTIVTGAPYDRERTTMRSFPMCAQCRAEYEDPSDRRFHAQPIACPQCGPRLQLCDAAGQPRASVDALAEFIAALRDGRIGALKGLGGYHLVCDATNESAVAALRTRKAREDKPFAIMVRTVQHAQRYCQVTATEVDLLIAAKRPIVLLRRRTPEPDIAPIAPACAPGNPQLGVMLPYTPLHHLLLAAWGDAPLVMTSANRSDEPIATREPDVFEQLRGIADVFLTHNREIHVRCDDSVTRIVGEQELPLRRSRGYAPEPIELSISAPVPLLAVGGQLKGTFALVQDRTAVLSHHLGDLDHAAAYRAFVQDVELYERLFQVKPRALVCDQHPDYASTQYAVARASQQKLPLIRVQHHHAHIASCLAEHGLQEPVIGVAFDGAGWGPDGASWGGEFLLADYAYYRRAAQLRYVALPGGDRAAREPWRMGLAYLLDADCDLQPIRQWANAERVQFVQQMIARRVNSPLTSSAGRLFDAVAAIIGLRGASTFEAQAAMELEWLAMQAESGEGYPFDMAPTSQTQQPWEVDLRPMIRAIVHDLHVGIKPARIARRFHITLVDVITAVCDRLRDESGRQDVVLSGGVFANALLLQEATDRLQASGFRVHRHQRVPCNDGGLSLGQLAVGAALLRKLPDYKTSTPDVAAQEMLAAQQVSFAQSPSSEYF